MYSLEQWRNDFINWISHDDLTFEQAASPYLKKVIVTGGPQVAKLLPSARTVRTWLANTYIERVPEVRAALARSLSKIHVSFDAWSSPNDLSLLGVVGHWIDEHAALSLHDTCHVGTTWSMSCNMRNGHGA